jgi:hypothetical protein
MNVPCVYTNDANDLVTEFLVGSPSVVRVGHAYTT